MKIESSDKLTFKFNDGKALFDPDKLLNLEGRFVKHVTFNYYPYSSYEEVVSGRISTLLTSSYISGNSLLQTPGSGNSDSQEAMLSIGLGETYPEKTILIDGTEGLMVVEFCKRFNCTLLFMPGEG